MPCYDPPHSYCKHGIEDVDNVICDLISIVKKFDRTRKREEEEFQDLKKHCDKLTRMLCQTCLVLETSGAIFIKELHEWWEKHKEWDRKRKDK